MNDSLFYLEHTSSEVIEVLFHYKAKATGNDLKSFKSISNWSALWSKCELIVFISPIYEKDM